jgi:hypothetical protein
MLAQRRKRDRCTCTKRTRGTELAEMAKPNLDATVTRSFPQDRAGITVHPAWLRLIRYCADLGHGEIEKLKIQDGLPMVAEVTTRKIKFSP